MKTREKILAALVLAAITLVSGAGLMGCGPGPVVVQGSVVSYDPASKDLVVRDEREPRAEIKLSLTAAEVGAEPAVGDTVRVAYRPEGDVNRAIRVMDITRQTELKGGGGH